MNQQHSPPGRLARFLDFCRRVGITAGIDLAAALVVWLVLSLFRGFGSPAGTIMTFSLPLFVLAILPVFMDVGRIIAVPVKALGKSQDETAQEMMAKVREQSEKGISQTFQFAAAGFVVVVIGFGVAVVFGA